MSLFCRACTVATQNNFKLVGEATRSSDTDSLLVEHQGEEGGIGTATGSKNEPREREITVTVNYSHIFPTRTDADFVLQIQSPLQYIEVR